MSASVETLVCIFGCASAWSGESLRLGDVDHTLSANGGCSLQLPHQYARKEGKYIFVSDQNGALVNVNGADVHLNLVKSAESGRPHGAKAGERSVVLYAADGLQVRVDYTLSETCPPVSNPCPVTNYDAVLSVKRGKATKTVAAKATCVR